MKSFVTLVVLSKNPPDSLMKEIDEQYFKNFEVIVADDDGIVRAMNNALDKANGNIFVRIDDDVKLPKHYLYQITKSFESDKMIGGVTAPTFIPVEYMNNRDSISFTYRNQHDPLFNWLMDGLVHEPARLTKCGSVTYASNFIDWIRNDKIYTPDYLEGTNWAVRTRPLRMIGGFDEDYDGVCEWFDIDATEKIKKLGYRLVYNQEAWLLHCPHRDSATYSERFAWGSRIRNWLRFHRRHSKFHPKKVLWLSLMVGYYLTRRN